MEMTNVSPVPVTLPEFETSAETDKLDDALGKAQGELLVAPKGKVNLHFNNKYADITAVWQACRGALAKHGISATQWPLHSTDGRLHIMTRLAHSGQWMRGRFSLPVQKQDPQGYGSATTYAKRFALAAAVGVVTEDEDDDANGAGTGNDRPEGMDASKLADHLAALEACADVDSLRKANAVAVAAAGKDKAALASIATAKTVRYRALTARPKDGAK